MSRVFFWARFQGHVIIEQLGLYGLKRMGKTMAKPTKVIDLNSGDKVKSVDNTWLVVQSIRRFGSDHHYISFKTEGDKHTADGAYPNDDILLACSRD